MTNERDNRPWGTYEVLLDAPTHKVKQLVVLPGKRLSYQYHHHRAEHWFVVRGEGRVTIDDLDREVKPGCAVDIPIGTKHRIECTGTEPLVFVEVQHGESFAEDDIVRLDDDFGRAS